MSIKYFPLIIALLVIGLAIGIHLYTPNSLLDQEAEKVAEEVVKEETGIDIKIT